MLLFEWGTYDWGGRPPAFEVGITRQLIVRMTRTRNRDNSACPFDSAVGTATCGEAGSGSAP